MQVRERKPVGIKATMVMNVLRAQAMPRPARRRWPLLFAGLAMALLAVAAARRIQERAEGGITSQDVNAVRSVSVVRPEPAAATAVTLPATLQANQATDLFPRVDGFVKKWHAEIGTQVRAGELLAEIDTPELDQEI